jgi:hypothetical protein
MIKTCLVRFENGFEVSDEIYEIKINGKMKLEKMSFVQYDLLLRESEQ